MNEVFHFGLQTPPSELDSDQFVCTHVRTVCLQLVLQGKGTHVCNIDLLLNKTIY